jgi:hypothetical protein
MLLLAADDIDVTSQHNIILYTAEANAAVGTDVDSVAKFDAALIEACAEFDTAVIVTFGKGQAIKLLAEVVAGNTRKEAEEL